MANDSLSVRVILSAYLLATVLLLFPDPTTAGGGFPVPVPVPARHGAVVKKAERWSVVTTEFGEISAVKVSDGRDGFYHLQFITMEPNSLFLPVHLHSDMVFYVDSGSGTLNWVDIENDDDKLRQVELQAGDVYRLRTGSFFYLQSNLESDRRKLRINAIFSDSKEEIREGSSFGAYASVRDLILGFDNRVLQAALSVDEEVIEELRSGGKQAMIVHGVAKAKANELWEVHYRIMKAFLGRMKNGMIDINTKNKKNKDKAYNILTADHDVENCNGWSLVVTSKQLNVLKDSDFSIFMVNLTKGAMMGPHWNPTTPEIGVVLRGRGMVHVVCPGTVNETECKNLRFRVEEGDVFVVPRYHPMAQMSFNNGSFVFMGFTTTTKKNHPQYLVGTASVLQVLDKRVLAASFGVSNTTMDQVLAAQREAIILECTSCAEEEERLMEEGIQREKEEEVRKKEEEEARKREEEEAREREEEEKREQEEARKREEEEARKREEKEKRRKEEEEEKAREEQEAREREEEERREQEEARKREEEEARRQEEEAARRKEEQEEEARRRQQEEEAGRKQQEEEEEAKRRHEEEEATRQQEEARKQQEEAARRKEEEKAARRQEEEEDARRQEEARKQQEEEATRREEEEAARKHQQEEEEARRRQQEEEAAARQQEEARRRQEEEAARQREEARGRHEEEEAARGGGGRGQGEGEAASRQEEEMARRERQAEAAARGSGGGQGAQGNGSYEE